MGTIFSTITNHNLTTSSLVICTGFTIGCFCNDFIGYLRYKFNITKKEHNNEIIGNTTIAIIYGTIYTGIIRLLLVNTQMSSKCFLPVSIAGFCGYMFCYNYRENQKWNIYIRTRGHKKM